MADPPEYLIVEEAAEFMRLPVATLNSFRSRGQGPRWSRVGRRVLYRRQDIIDWIESLASDEPSRLR